jgi:hypothetical protein
MQSTQAVSTRRAVLLVLALAAAVAAVLAATLVRGAGPTQATASSHSEAPLISADPRVDNTDLYAFVSPDRPDTVTIIANYIPLEAPASGPNFYSFDDTARYEINIDNTGDGTEDISYQFEFKTTTRNDETFLYNTGPIASLDDPNWNRPQVYTVKRVVRGNERTLGKNLPTPPANIGPRSTPNYDALAAAAVSDLPGGVRVFAGQRDDPFYVDLGSVFDLAGLRPFNTLHLIPLPTEAGVDAVAQKNVHTIAIQVPIADVVKIPNASIGIYASASRREARTLRRSGDTQQGRWVQVSRLGEPLINEVLIPLGKKDRWNRSEPRNDSQFLEYYTDPEPTVLENLLYPVLDDATTTNRQDLVAILLTGVPGLNFTGSQQSDLLRLNTTIAPTAPVGAGDRLGVLNGDLAGFPNGRRLEDDVVDIELRALAEGYGSFLNGALGLPNRSPNNLIGDGVDANDKAFSTTFPYVASPFQGYEVP